VSERVSPVDVEARCGADTANLLRAWIRQLESQVNLLEFDAYAHDPDADMDFD
jgi:hypothetical protein